MGFQTNTPHPRFIALPCALLLAASCTSPDQCLEHHAHERVMKAGSYLAMEHGRDDSFTARQLESLLGEPEERVALQDFFGRLEGRSVEPVDELERRLVGRLSAHLDRVRRTTRQPSSTAAAEEAMARCDVWLYRWSNPAEVTLYVVGSTVPLSWTVRSMKVRYSYVYVIYDSRLIHWDSVERKVP